MLHGFERQKITVMFCELIGSISFFERRGSADFTQAIEHHRTMCAQQVHGFGGKIVYYQGDNMLACFGYPTIDPDSPEQAVRAAIGIVDGVRNKIQNTKTAGIQRLNVRIGIDTGMAVVGYSRNHDGSDTLEAFGRPVNVAAWLQSQAGSNQIIASEVTKSIVNQRVQFRQIFSHKVEGSANSIEIFEVCN